MLRHISLFLSLTVLAFVCAACQVTPETSAQITDALNRVTTVLDRDNDGVITNPEVRQATDPNNPMTWVSLTGIVTGILGLIKAQSVQKQTNELYDVTHAPVAKPA